MATPSTDEIIEIVFPVIEAGPSPVPSPSSLPSVTQPELDNSGSFLARYFRKFKGDATKRPPARSRTVARDAVVSGLTAFICIFCIAEIHSQGIILTRQDLYLLIPPFGATAVLVFAMPAAPVAQVSRLTRGYSNFRYFASLSHVPLACTRCPQPDCCLLCWCHAPHAVG